MTKANAPRDSLRSGQSISPMPTLLTLLRIKTILPLITLLMSSLTQAEDMQKYLSDTKDLTRAGKYEEALKRHIWFHDHALEHQPSMYGVRLSFALSNWKELGDKYPPAKQALVETRDRKMKTLLDGKESHELFHDVSSINETLGESEKTVSLFEDIDEKQPKIAKSYRADASKNPIKDVFTHFAVVLPIFLYSWEGCKIHRISQASHRA